MSAPPLKAILETALYVSDLARAGAFYEKVMGLPVLHADDRMRAYDVQGCSVLLLFLRGGTTEPVRTQNALIPAHDATGQIHIAFSIDADQLEPWRAHLSDHAITIEGTSDWQRGGQSLYFRDPDGNMLEVATTPGLWKGF